MEKRDYDVAEGVPWVNGTRVPANRIVSLTEAEAHYDLALGRISLKGGRRAKPVTAATTIDEASDQ
jgi:hypothetical protein